jgi:hypothetical protein
MITRDPLDAVEDVTVIIAIPDLIASCVDVAEIVAVPVDDGVKTPVLLTLPILDGLTDQVTELMKFPVPFTVGVQVEVCVVRMDEGEQVTATEVIVGGAVIVIVAPPDFVASSVEVAVMVAVPELGTVAGAV